MRNRAEISRSDVAIVPKRRPELEGARRRDTDHARMHGIHQMLRWDRARTCHKEEEGNGGRIAESQYGSERATPDRRCREHSSRRVTRVPSDGHSRGEHEARRGQNGRETPARCDRERGRRMRERDAECGAIGLAGDCVGGAEHGAQCARLERDGEWIETAATQPDEQYAETKQRHAEARALKAREDEQPFGVNAA